MMKDGILHIVMQRVKMKGAIDLHDDGQNDGEAEEMLKSAPARVVSHDSTRDGVLNYLAQQLTSYAIAL